MFLTLADSYNMVLYMPNYHSRCWHLTPIRSLDMLPLMASRLLVIHSLGMLPLMASRLLACILSIRLNLTSSSGFPNHFMSSRLLALVGLCLVRITRNISPNHSMSSRLLA